MTDGSTGPGPGVRGARIATSQEATTPGVAVVHGTIANAFPGANGGRPNEVLHELLLAARLLTERLKRWHGSRGLPLFTHETLSALAAAPPDSGLSPSVLARGLEITTGTMTHRLNVLESAGLVRRSRVGGDRRRRAVLLTDKGRRVFERLTDQQQTFEAGLMSPLDEESLERLHQALAVLRKASGEEQGSTPGG
jgi:DNA-binding MarR family transcriptional regulator